MNDRNNTREVVARAAAKRREESKRIVTINLARIMERASEPQLSPASEHLVTLLGKYLGMSRADAIATRNAMLAQAGIRGSLA